MADGPPASSPSDLDQWLSNLGFSRGNPFATAEADQERELLPEFFVDVEGYERIKGDKTIIVFAPRGGGKSALRVVLACQAAPRAPEATTLAVEHTDFDALIAKRREGQVVTIIDHVPRLLRSGAKALIDALCGDPAIELPEEKTAKDKQARALRAASIAPPTRSRLAHLLRIYHPSLLNPEALYERLHALDPAFASNWMSFVRATTEHRLNELVDSSGLCTDDIARFLADLNDYPDMSADTGATSTEQIKAFANVASSVGLTSVQFLVDRVDETEETTDDPEAQADILEPLLAHLSILETPGVAFKFFLSRKARDILMERTTIRRDRLTDQAVTVTWNKGQLKHMLDERLAVYGDEQVHDLIQLCQETRVDVGRGQSPRLLGKWIEDEMLQLAQGSPRRLLLAAQLMCQIHLGRRGPDGLLERADWEAAKVELIQKMPPTLRLRRAARIAWVGGRNVELTPQQHKILIKLVDSHGHCDRESLADAVWGTKEGVSEEAIDRAIGRLRERLGDDPSASVYLVTERGEGFRLQHYDIE